MSNSKSIVFLLMTCFCLSSAIVASSQGQSTSQPPAQQTPPNAPLELPDFLVTGKAVVDIAAGAKQTPQMPFRLNASELDSLNPTEKFPAPAVPNRALPTFRRSRSVHRGYLDASFGSYTTPALAAGAEFKIGEYIIDAALDGLYAADWTPGASVMNAGLALSSSYVAPEKFYLFGKGLTETDLQVRLNEYTLFANSAAPIRSTTRVFAAVATEAFVGDMPITAQLHWNSHSVADQGAEGIRDQRIHANLQAQLTSRYRGMLDVNMQSRGDASYPFMQASIIRVFGDSLLRMRATVGAQFATSTADDSRFGLLADLSAEYEADEFMSYGLTLRSGMRALSFADQVTLNPFLSTSSLIDVPYELLNISATVKYHPSQQLQVLGRVLASHTTRSPLWVGASSFQFDLTYHEVTLLAGNVELLYRASSRDVLSAAATAQSAMLSTGQHAPYVEPLRIDATYQRAFSSDLQSALSLQYVGRRYVELDNAMQLDAFLNLQFRASYALSRTLDLQVVADNLINSTIIIWNGYRERGIFVSGGVSMRF